MCVCVRACTFAFVSGMPGCVKKIEYNTVNVGIKNEYLYTQTTTTTTYIYAGIYMYKSNCYDNLLVALQAIVHGLYSNYVYVPHKYTSSFVAVDSSHF